jgi:hypothetical protein
VPNVGHVLECGSALPLWENANFKTKVCVGRRIGWQHRKAAEAAPHSKTQAKKGRRHFWTLDFLTGVR